MKKFFVYFHLTSDTHLPFYVGKGMHRSKKSEFSRVHSKAGRTKLWKNVVSKHGILANVVDQSLEENEAFFWESFYVKLFGRRDQGKGPLVNMTDGGEGVSGVIYTPERRKKLSDFHSSRMKSEETKRKLSEVMTISEELRAKINAGLKGRKLSAEHIANRSKSLTGLKRSENTRKRMSESPHLYELFICPHCQTSGKGSAMKRWHFKNCKRA